MMTKTERIVRSVLGPSGGDIRPLVCAVDLFARRMFLDNIPMDDIRVTKDIYSVAAKRLQKNPKSIARRIERLANLCWDKGNRERLNEIIGRDLSICPAPREMLVYFAFFSYLDTPFFVAIEQQPPLLF